MPTDENILGGETGPIEGEHLPEMPEQPPVDDASSSVMQDIWDNFKNYQANKEKMDNMLIGEVSSLKFVFFF